MKIIKMLLLFTVIITGISCKKYLDVSDELAGGLANVDEVFENPAYTRRWYANVMSGVPDYSTMIKVDWDEGGMNGLHNPWTCMTDEVHAQYGDAARYLISARNASNMGFQRWRLLYDLIRQANIFLEKAKVIPPAGVDADRLDQEEYDKLKVNTLFMRAYYHYLLFEQYGPVPIQKKSYWPGDNLDLPRNSVDEVVEFISSQLDSVIPLLPQAPIEDEQLRANPTKGVALAVKTKLWIYAASPLFNGGYTEALELADKEGKKLFPATNPAKWGKALEAAKKFIEYAETNGHKLYVAQTNGKDDPEKSVYELFQTYNNEIIWATPKNGWGGMNGDRFERRATPRSEPNGLGNTTVLQELIDDFYMKDGLPVKATGFLPASTLYSEKGFSDYNGVQVFNMWINREPRFYNTVFFAGRKWHISTKGPVYFHKGSANDTRGQHPANGYLLYKRFNRRVYLNSPGVASIFRPSIVFRLAEFYLLYAEALNEVEPGNSDVLTYVNMVRARAGIPALETLNSAIAGNKELQRSAIQRESRIELATEGQRYFDVRRWMIADKPEGRQGGDFSGMNMEGDATTFYTRRVFQSRWFDRKLYLYPIPFVEMQKSKVLVQNPGW